jgi:hypothetical protein
MLPVLGGEVVKGQQAVPILLQRFCRLRIFRRIDRHETIERGVCLGARGGHPDRLHVGLCACLLRLRQRIEHVAHLVKPAALATRDGKHLFQCRPEAHRAVADGQQRTSLQATRFQVKQQLQPRRLGLTVAVADRHALFAPIRPHADDHE